ncbi:MAG: alpha-mannosidase [Acidobacteria bacterium]|nr:alpha-mannosidase [Acidobacteriota bacterium]
MSNFSSSFLRLVLLGSLAAGAAALAQDVQPAAANVLSPASNETLKTLNALSTIPGVSWRYHAGDLAHGEAANLDDSQWKKVTKSLSAGLDAAWFRTTVTVPKSLKGYDITGARLWLNLSVHKPTGEIVYVNGRRIALGEDLEPIVLTEEAHPGDVFKIAVKLLPSPEPKTLNSGTVLIEPDSKRPRPGDLREEALAVSTMLPATAKAGDADEVNAAIAMVDTAALVKGDQAAFDASLRKAHEALMKFRPALQSVTVDMAGNSHIDAAWRWTESETIDVVRRTYGTAATLMSEYPNYKFTQSAAQYNEWLKEKYPAINQEIKRRIKEGRWEIVGGMWVEPDLNMPDGESLVRQLLVGKRFYKHEYGVDVRIGWNPDSFGYNWQLPQIYKRSGVDYFVTQKMHWNDTNQLPLRLFWWESPDGSKVLTYFPTGYGHNDLHPSREARDYMQAWERVPGTKEVLDLYGVGDHGGGPTRIVLDEGEKWSGPGTVTPHMQFSTAQNYFDHVEKTIVADSPEWNYDTLAKGWKAPADPGNGKIEIPTWKDELYLEYHRGVFTTQAQHKAYMRNTEVAVLDAEKFASLAWLKGKPYPGADFEADWKKISFGQFHDLAAGSGIGQIYKDAARDYENVLRQARESDNTSLTAILAAADTRASKGVPVAVVNPLAWDRSDAVVADVQMGAPAKDIHMEDAQGHALLSQVLSSDAATGSFRVLVEPGMVPSLGYTVLRAVPTAQAVPSDLHAEGFTMENAKLKVVVDPKTGCITSMVEKKTNFETIASGGCGNQLQTFADNPEKYDAWNIDPGTLDHFTPITAVSSVKLIENGPVRATIEIERTWQKSHFTQQVVLEAGSDHVQFNNKIDWREDHVLLKAAFPLAATSAKATYEIPYGTIERPTTRDNSFEKARFEVPAIRWADLGDGQHGVSLLNQTKYGYDAVGNWLRLTLLRSPKAPDPDADMGMQQFSYAVYPHAGDWKQAMSMRHGYEFNYPLRAVQTFAHSGAEGASHSFASTDADNVVITAIKKAEDRDALVVRMFEWAGKSGDVKLHVPAGATYAVSSDLMENPEAAHLKMDANTVTVPVHPYEIVTVQVMYKH